MKTLLEQAIEKRPDLAGTHRDDLVNAQAVLDGDKDSFGAIYNKYYIHMFRAAMLKTGFNEDLSKDLAIETMTKVYENLGKYKFETATLGSWITFVGRNHMLNHFKALKKNTYSVEVLGMRDDEGNTSSFEITDSGKTPEELLLNKEDLGSLKACIAKLKDNSRTALDLVELQDKSYAEAAEEMGISLSNLKVTLMRAKQELKSMLIGTGIQVNVKTK